MYDAAKVAGILQIENLPARISGNPALTKMLATSRPVRALDQMTAARPRTSAQSQAFCRGRWENSFEGEDIPRMSMNERARVNIEFTFRRSEGWRREISSDPRADVDRLLGELGLEELADRDVNRGFSGRRDEAP